MAGDEKFNIGPQAKDIDFYVGGLAASAFINDLSISVTASAITIATGISSSEIQSSSAFSSSKISFASSSIDLSISKTSTPTEILQGLIHLDSETSVTASAMKVAKASSAVDIVSSLVMTGTRITKAHTDIAVTTTAQINAIKTVNGRSVVGVTTSTSFLAGEIVFGLALIRLVSKANINPPVRFSPSFIDYSSIRTFLILDGKPLTNHNREFDISIAPSFIENRNWNNRKNRYYKRASESGRKTFSLSWRFLPNFMEKTVDTRHGRDFISSVSEDPDVHVLKVINQDQNGLTPYTETTYNVFVRSYSETLLRRDLSDGVYYFDCSLTLEEA
jgi:hypothetical protein